MTPIIPSLSPLFEFLLPRNISGTDFGTRYGLWFSYPTPDIEPRTPDLRVRCPTDCATAQKSSNTITKEGLYNSQRISHPVFDAWHIYSLRDQIFFVKDSRVYNLHDI